MTTEPIYPALARLVADSNGSKHHLAELTELADAERMAQAAPCGKSEHSGTLTFSGARGPECLLCSQSAEIERLREQIRELESQIADPSLVRALMIPRDSQSEQLSNAPCSRGLPGRWSGLCVSQTILSKWADSLFASIVTRRVTMKEIHSI